MAKKKAFLLYTDMRERMAMLTNEEAGLLFKAILDYAADGKPFATENRLLEYAFSEVKQQLERDAEKYEAIRRKRANAGAEGAKRRWEKARAAETPIAESEQSQDAKETDNTDTTGTATGTDSKGAKNDKPKGYEKFDLAFVEAEYKEAFYKWLNYKRERGEKYQGQSSLEAAYGKLVSYCNGESSKAADIVENSMANNWAGLFELKESGKQCSAHRTGDYTTMQVSTEYPKWKR